MTSKQVFNLQKMNLKRKYRVQKKRVEEVYDTQIDPEFVHNKVIDLEDRSRGNNVRIYGATETNDETWQKYEQSVEQVFSEKLELKNIRGERGHRVKRRKGDKSKTPV